MSDSKSIGPLGITRVGFLDPPVYFFQLPERFWVLKNKVQTGYSRGIANELHGLMLDKNNERTSTVEKRLFGISNGTDETTGMPIPLPPDRCRQLWKSCGPLLRVLERCFPDTGFSGGWLETYLTAYGKRHSHNFFAIDATPLDIAFKLFPTPFRVFEKLGVPIWMPPKNDWGPTRVLLEKLSKEQRAEDFPNGIPKTYAEFASHQLEERAEAERLGLKVTWVHWTVEQRKRFPQTVSSSLSQPPTSLDFPSTALMLDAGWHENPFCFSNDGKGYERKTTGEGVK